MDERLGTLTMFLQVLMAWWEMALRTETAGLGKTSFSSVTDEAWVVERWRESGSEKVRKVVGWEVVGFIVGLVGVGFVWICEVRAENCMYVCI